MQWVSQLVQTNFSGFSVPVKIGNYLEIVDKELLLDSSSAKEMLKLISNSRFPPQIVGESWNVLPQNSVIRSPIVRFSFKGIELISEDDNTSTVKVEAGTPWQELINWTITNNLGGLENLTSIPGSVGAAPIQNIGAYGVEVAETIKEIEVFDLNTGRIVNLSNQDCGFSYRTSRFKVDYRRKYWVVSVKFLLTKLHNKGQKYKYKLDYPLVIEQLAKQLRTDSRNIKSEIAALSLSDVEKAVRQVRLSKLPDHNKIGTAGSFFKHPILSNTQFQKLSSKNPDVPSFPMSRMEQTQTQGFQPQLKNTDIVSFHKIPAGWLIEQAGWKGKSIELFEQKSNHQKSLKSRYGVFPKHSLVLVNYFGATAEDIWQLSSQIQADVSAKFGVMLEPEVNSVL